MSKKIVCIGSMSLDITCIAGSKLNMGGKNPGATVLVDAGGVTRNSGEVLARMGHDVAIVSTVGTDDFGKTAIDLCEGIGMDMTHVTRLEGGKTTASIQMIDFDGEVAVMAADVSDKGDVSLEQVKAAHELISSAAVILVCPTLGVETIEYIFETYKDIPKFMDACALQFIEKIRPFLKGVHTLKVNEEEAAALCAEDIEILYEDDFLMVVNKPSGMLSVPGIVGGVSVEEHLQNAFPASDIRVVHRLDMATSGLLLVAKSVDVFSALQREFAMRRVEKRYVALLDGTIATAKGEISLPLLADYDNRPRQMVDYCHGKEALTRYEVIEKIVYDGRECTKVAFYPVTGRTHQLRVHSAHAGGLNTPIIGDELYGSPDKRLMLHAEYLKFTHPVTGEVVELTAAADFQ